MPWSKALGAGLIVVSMTFPARTVAGNPAFPGAPGRIAFQSTGAGSWDVFTMNPDGSDIVDLTNSPTADEYDPVWSPGGRQIAFWTDEDIWVMNADGSNLHPLTATSANRAPAWSPDALAERLGRDAELGGDRGDRGPLAHCRMGFPLSGFRQHRAG
jgi:Tol biopolymer transport system component